VTPPQVSAILVNYNAGHELARALQSIADEFADERWEAVVVDNASSDGSAEVVADFAPNVLLHRNVQNTGFARGVNQGLAATSGSLVLLMNPDCRLVPGAFDMLRRELERSHSYAIVGPRILNPDGTVQGSARGDPDMFTGLFGRTTVLRRLFPGLAVARRNVVSGDGARSGDGSVTVDWLSGACLLAHRDALQSVNGFDERIFYTGKTRIFAGACEPSGGKCVTYQVRQPCIGSASQAAVSGRRRYAHFMKARICTTRHMSPQHPDRSGVWRRSCCRFGAGYIFAWASRTPQTGAWERSTREAPALTTPPPLGSPLAHR
jgi:hypothetical protein